MSANTWGPIRQIAYVVEDLDDAMRRWATQLGVGPWTVYRNTALQGVYRGRETAVKMHVGLSYQDQMQIELIQPLSRTPSPYQDESGRARVGMHHMAWITQDFDAEVQRAQARGLRLVFAAGNEAVRVAYLESAEEAGPLFEFIAATPPVLEGFAAGLQATREWDGVQHPLQSIDFDTLSP